MVISLLRLLLEYVFIIFWTWPPDRSILVYCPTCRLTPAYRFDTSSNPRAKTLTARPDRLVVLLGTEIRPILPLSLIFNCSIARFDNSHDWPSKWGGKPTCRHVKGFLTRQLDIYHTIPLPTILETKPRKSEQSCEFTYNNPTIPECERSCEPTYNNPTIQKCERSCEPAYNNGHVIGLLTR